MGERHGLGAVSYETAFEQEITPTPADFDELGHVNNAVYLQWTQALATTHWRLVAPPEIVSRVIFVVLRHEIDYRDGILPGEAVIGRTWLGRARGPRFERFVDIRKKGVARPSAYIRTDWCMLDIETRKPQRVGEHILSAFDVPG